MVIMKCCFSTPVNISWYWPRCSHRCLLTTLMSFKYNSKDTKIPFPPGVRYWERRWNLCEAAAAAAAASLFSHLHAQPQCWSGSWRWRWWVRVVLRTSDRGVSWRNDQGYERLQAGEHSNMSSVFTNINQAIWHKRECCGTEYWT